MDTNTAAPAHIDPTAVAVANGVATGYARLAMGQTITPGKLYTEAYCQVLLDLGLAQWDAEADALRLA